MGEILLWLESSPAFMAVALATFGACMGSFINLVALRLPPLLMFQWKLQSREILEIEAPVGEDIPPGIAHPRSRCPNCLEPLKVFHNIPVLGYLLIRGKCAFCRKTVSLRYPSVEIVVATVSVLLGFHFGMGWHLLFSMVFTYGLLTLSLIDYDYQILPDNIVLPLLWTGLLANMYGLFTDIESAVTGAVAGYLALWTIYQIHHRLTGKEGMGYGDFKLLGAIGAWLGWQMLPLVILVASLAGTVIAGLTMIIRRQGRDIPVPFGPYLATAAWVALIWGKPIVDNYLSAVRF